MGAIDMFNDFVKLIESESLPVEAVAIADGDAIIAERHFVPDQNRNIYSHMKSYVSTAIGIAIEDGLLSLNSRLVDSFPEYVPSDTQPELGQITTVLSKQGLVVAIQCPESGDFDNIVRPALHEHLLLPLTA